MIYITGDIHGDIKRFKNAKIKKLKQTDTLLICGDFAFSVAKNKAAQKTLKWLGKRKYTIAFVDGANDDYEKIKTYPETEWGM
ncbi:MAG: metallophosphoesterase family protein, partial [Oscillospiraceae bacterium]